MYINKTFYNYFFLTSTVCRYVPESMRWLQTQNRIEEMAKILAKVAKSNGKALPSNVTEALKVQANPSKEVKVITIYFCVIYCRTHGLSPTILILWYCRRYIMTLIVNKYKNNHTSCFSSKKPGSCLAAR